MLARAKESAAAASAKAAATAAAASATAAAASRAGAEKAKAGAEQAKASAAAAAKASFDAVRRRRVAKLSEDQVGAVRALFDSADTLGRGAIDRLELRKAFDAKSGRWLSDAELEAFWAELAPEGEELIDFPTFLLEVGPSMFPPKAVQLLGSLSAAVAERAAPVADTLREKARTAAGSATDQLLSKVLDAVRQAASAEALDPDMPRPLRRAVAYALSCVLEDLEAQVRDTILGMIAKDKPPPAAPPRHGLVVAALRRARAFVLYTLRPCDKSLWVSVRSPGFWLLSLAASFPLYGVQPCCFLLMFALIDRGDEFQLVAFILAFKGSMFFSLGLVQTVLGAALYYAAGSAAAFPVPVWSSALFLAQQLAVWGAFALLPYSQEKGRRRLPLPGEPAEEPEGACCGATRYRGRGGRLRPLLAWELLSFALALGMVAAALGLRASDARRSETIYWARTVYGLLALPFVPFTLPGVGAMLTHALPTAYDRHGHCVPLLSGREMREARAERVAAVERARDARALRARARVAARNGRGARRIMVEPRVIEVVKGDDAAAVDAAD